MDIQYGQLESLNWLWLVAAIAIVSFAALALHHRSMKRFATPGLLTRLLDAGRPRRRFVSTLFILLAMVFIVIGLVDIRWGQTQREVPQKGIEVIFVLDVSRSMLAEDVAPNRLSRAKQNIKDMVREMVGDRIGLVLFAGDVRHHVPLTNHYEDFKQSLDEVGPHNITRGGSNLGEAISVAADSFLEKTADHKAIVLITDGEDHDSQPITVAKKARDTGIRIFTVGLGDMTQGARIPVETRGRGADFIEHDGQQVWSKLDGEILKQIATTTGGAFIPAGTKQVDMGAVYHKFIAGIDQQEFETATVNAYIPRYQLFLGAALAFLLLEILASTWRRKEVSLGPEKATFETLQNEERQVA